MAMLLFPKPKVEVSTLLPEEPAKLGGITCQTVKTCRKVITIEQYLFFFLESPLHKPQHGLGTETGSLKRPGTTLCSKLMEDVALNHSKPLQSQQAGGWKGCLFIVVSWGISFAASSDLRWKPSGTVLLTAPWLGCGVRGLGLSEVSCPASSCWCRKVSNCLPASYVQIAF